MLREAIDYIRKEKVKIEESNTVWKGRWVLPGPQMIVILTRNR